MRALVFVAFLSLTGQALAQPSPKRLRQDVKYLASDKLAGRATGTRYEQLAAKYLVQQLGQSLQPKGSDGPFQPFEYTAFVRPGVANKLSINGTLLAYGTDWYALGQSKVDVVNGALADGGFGIAALDGRDDFSEAPAEAKVFFVNAAFPDNNPHGKYAALANTDDRLRAAKHAGARAVIFYADDSTSLPEANLSRSKAEGDVVAIALTPAGRKKIRDFRPGSVASIRVDIQRIKATGHNVCFFKNNNAKKTIVLGAHYDHLGHGEQGGSLYRGKDSLIHNGADDNASGTAALMELARYYATKQGETYNYLFLWFSGEEEGLLGSSYWTKNPTVPIDQIAYMVNMDMVGRLANNKLAVNGVGTSPIWASVIDTVGKWGLQIKTTQSGIGASDHTSFYLKQIPALFLFTGTHADYHKPTDDWKKLNYEGMAAVCRWVIQLNEAMATKPAPTFTPTGNQNNEEAPAFKVTLGIVPDYMFEGTGVRIDGVSAGKPAEKAGLKAGDIVLQMGQNTTPNLQAYMKALGNFAHGDKTTVQVKRGDKQMEMEVTF